MYYAINKWTALREATVGPWECRLFASPEDVLMWALLFETGELVNDATAARLLIEARWSPAAVGRRAKADLAVLGDKLQSRGEAVGEWLALWLAGREDKSPEWHSLAGHRLSLFVAATEHGIRDRWDSEAAAIYASSVEGVATASAERGPGGMLVQFSGTTSTAELTEALRLIAPRSAPLAVKYIGVDRLLIDDEFVSYGFNATSRSMQTVPVRWSLGVARREPESWTLTLPVDTPRLAGFAKRLERGAKVTIESSAELYEFFAALRSPVMFDHHESPTLDMELIQL